MPYLVIPDSVISLYVTPETEPVAPETVFMRTPFWEFLMVDPLMVTVLTVLSERPPTLPIERPVLMSVQVF